MRPPRRASDRSTGAGPTSAGPTAAGPTASGQAGEALAAAALQQAGYRIVARNLRTKHGEIDLLIRRGRDYAAVEVKARAEHPCPERLVDHVRLDRIRRGLLTVEPTLRPRPRTLRIDVVAIRWQPHLEIRHFRTFATLSRPGDATAPKGLTVELPHAAPKPTAAVRRFLAFLPMTSLSEQIMPRRKLLLILCETVLITGLLLLGTSMPPLASRAVDLFTPSRDLLRGVMTCLTIAVICQAALSYSDLYDWKTSQNRAELLNRLVHSCGYALLMLAALVIFAPSLFSFPGFADVGRETPKLILLLGVVFVALYLFRTAFHWFFYKWRFGERLVVLGSSKEALQIARLVVDHPMSGFEVVGIVEEPDQPPLERLPHDPPLLGGLESLRDFCREEGISRVVVALRERRGRLPSERLLECRMDGVLIEEREAMFERITGKLAVESMRPSYLIYGRGFAKDPVTLTTKRVLDILAASLGLLLSLPVSLLAALAVKLTSPGPVFFTQERVGEDGRLFKVVKFRTMRSDAEKATGPVWAQKNDSRVTKVGKFLRLTRIDEIPQFLNILAGQMSFVGPRPERPHFVEQLTKEIPFYMLRHTVKPGLTGWAQVCHPYGASVEDAREKLRYDLYYIKNLGFLFDLNIMLRTVAVILSGKGAR